MKSTPAGYLMNGSKLETARGITRTGTKTPYELPGRS